MEERFHVMAFLENDANAGALAEWRFGAAKGCRHAAFLTFGTGLGAGLILNGALYQGASDMAGECGHIRLMLYGPVGCSKIGSAEGFCSGGGIAQLARDMVYERIVRGEKPPLCPTVNGLNGLTAKSVAEAAYAGDPLAGQIYEVSGEMPGRTLAILIDLLNLEVIVIGSIFVRAESLLRPAMERSIAPGGLHHLGQGVQDSPCGAGRRDRQVRSPGGRVIAWGNSRREGVLLCICAFPGPRRS